MAGRENILMGVSYLHPIFWANFSASAFCKLQLILRSCGCGIVGVELALVQPRVAPRSPPCSFFYKCILQGAIDFAEAADAVLRAWSGMLHVLRRGELCTRT